MNITDLGDMPFAVAKKQVVSVSERYSVVTRKGNRYTLTTTQSIPILAHEWGHVLFYESARVHFEFLEKIDMLDVKLDEIKSKLQIAYKEAMDLEKSANLYPDKDAYRKLMEESQTEYFKLVEESELIKGQLNQINEVFIPYKLRSGPYDEFWGDVISMLYTENPAAIYNTLDMRADDAYISAERRKEIVRRNPVAHINHLSKPESIHTKLREAMEFLWDQYLKKPSVMKRKADIAPAVLKALFSELQWAMSFPLKEDLETEDPLDVGFMKTQNDRLKKALQRELADFK
ncbi:MAG TPA: hypothetical protein VIG33_06395 [Pseudobdellovibrionaceae bacterium]